MNFIHALNRGVEKRSIAQDDKDRLRFVASLYEMNNARHVENTARSALFEVRPRTDDRERLVTVHAWCLMGNHYHLLISDAVSEGVSLFLKKLNVGYTLYFNLRHERNGVLFQGKTKRIPITTDAHYLYILPYIHLNPLDFLKNGRDWRTQCIKDQRAAVTWITDYRWSSYRNYVGEQEFSSILAGSDFFADRKAHVKELERFLKSGFGADDRKLNLE